MDPCECEAPHIQLIKSSVMLIGEEARMDYFQGVVTEYLRADRSCFVNPEFWIRGNLESPQDKPHWFVDVLAISMRDKAVFL